MEVNWAASATGPRPKFREARRLLLGLTTVLGASVLGGCLPTAGDGPHGPHGGTQIGVRTTAQQVMRVHKSDAHRRPATTVQLKAPLSTADLKTDRLPVGPMWTYPRNEPLLPRLAERRFPPYEPTPEAAPGVGRGGAGLAKFFSALNDLEAGSRREPITILHLGDSHIASDRFSGDVREMLQARFGDAGRGALMPGYPFRGYRARGVKFGKKGTWSTASSLKKDKGPYGISGVRLTANGKGAELRLESKNGPFEWADVTFLAGPGRGKAVISIDDGTRTVDTRAKVQTAKHVHIDQKGTRLKVRTTGGGKVSILSWAIGHARPGVRYINFGIPSVTAEIAQRWDEDLITKDIETLKPDLIVLGYGTNEGFNDGLKLGAYKDKFRSFINTMKAAAPDAGLVFIGPADGARLPRFARSRRKSAGCRPLTDDEKKNYHRIYRARDKRVRQWHAPPKLSAVRHAIAELSKEYGGYYWDWSAMMGGECGIHQWVKSDPKLAMSDHVHITADGSRKSAEAFFKDLMAAYEAHRQVASR